MSAAATAEEAGIVVPLAHGATTQVPRHELLQLLMDGLSSLGMQQTLASLQQEAHLEAPSDPVQAVASAMAAGDWDGADDIIVSKLQFQSQVNVPAVRLACRRQQYLELLEAGEKRAALLLLRRSITPLVVPTPGTGPRAAVAAESSSSDTMQDHDGFRQAWTPADVHRLAALMLCRAAPQLREQAAWPEGSGAGSREALVAQIRAVLVQPANQMPANRFTELLGQALQSQCDRCQFHNCTKLDGCLRHDHACKKESLPCTSVCTLSDAASESWQLRFSPDGSRLASANSNATITIWKLPPYMVSSEPGPGQEQGTSMLLVPELLHTLTGPVVSHSGITSISWHPAGTQIAATCTNRIWVWDVATGALLHRFTSDSKPCLLSVAWLPNGKQLLSGGVAPEVVLWDMDSKASLDSWATGRVNQLEAPAAGDQVVALCRESVVMKLELSTARCAVIEESSPATSLAVSKDGQFALVNLQDANELHLMNLSEGKIVQTYRGHTQSRYVIHSALGGAGEGFVASGSEDAQVYIWNRASGALVNKLAGHAAVVSTVAWSPTHPGVLASGSDDQTVRIWMPATN